MRAVVSDRAITTTAVAGDIVPSRVQLYGDMAAERIRAARPLRLVEYVAVYATTHEVEIETVRQYRISAEQLERWAGGPVYLTDLSELLLSAFLREYAHRVRPSTVRSKRTQLMALWRSAADEYLCEPPRRRVRSARVPWQPREAWTLDEVRQLVRAASWLPRTHSCGMRRAEWFDLAIRVAWDSGLRWGDQVRLRADDVHGDLVIVPQSKTSRPACGRLTASTVEILRDTLRRHPRAFVTPWTASHETFNDQVRRLVAKAGIRPGTWKWLRRGGATDVEIQAPGKGMAARHLGHAPGSRIAEINYLDHVQIAAAVPMVTPREIGGAA